MVIDYTRDGVRDALRDYNGVRDLLAGQPLEDAVATVKPRATVVSLAGTPEPVTARRRRARR